MVTTLANRTKVAAVSRESQEEPLCCRNSKRYITQVSAKIGKITKKLSQEFNRSGKKILGALSKTDEEFFENSQVLVQSGNTSGILGMQLLETGMQTRVISELLSS